MLVFLPDGTFCQMGAALFKLALDPAPAGERIPRHRPDTVAIGDGPQPSGGPDPVLHQLDQEGTVQRGLHQHVGMALGAGVFLVVMDPVAQPDGRTETEELQGGRLLDEGRQFDAHGDVIEVKGGHYASPSLSTSGWAPMIMVSVSTMSVSPCWLAYRVCMVTKV